MRIGHRGAAGHVDEDTLESIKKAIELRCSMVEIDARKCESGEIILIHDKKVNRTTNGRGKVRKIPYEDIKKLRTKSGYKIPTLEQAFKLMKGKCKINIEIKDKNSYLEILNLVEKYDLTHDVLISSFKWEVLKKIKKLNPLIKTGLLSKRRIGRIKIAQKLGCYSVHPHFSTRVTKRFVDRAHKKDLKVIVWAINWLGFIDGLRKIGVDGIISDYPERI